MHDIPQSKRTLISASDKEYGQGEFDFVSKGEGQEIIEMFGGNNNLKKHCAEIISIVREERGKSSLFEAEELPQ